MSNVCDVAATGHNVEYIRLRDPFISAHRQRHGTGRDPVNDHLKRSELSIGEIRPFRISVPEDVLEDLGRRLRMVRSGSILPREPRLGFDQAQLTRLASYWRDEFDWHRVQSELNRFEHLLVAVDDLDIHAVHCRGEGPDRMPLIITHGWPSSFVEILPTIELLTRPVAHGGRPEDAFDVVVPSLPGYVFSGAPRELADATAARIARRFHGLMNALGYARYGASGGDVGARVTAWLGAQEADALIGLHMSGNAISPDVAVEADERGWLEQEARFWPAEGAYFEMQRTKPRTLGMALNDSPLGLAAWIVEKWTDWGGTNGDALARFGEDNLLTTVMLYWATGSIASSLLTYSAFDLPPGPRPPAGMATPPAGLYLCPDEPRLIPPKRWAERQYDVARWSVLPRGGHFLPTEEPELFVRDLREFFRPLRASASALDTPRGSNVSSI
jgi:pimeloyl-ACP methyl ester carboxylesterase